MLFVIGRKNWLLLIPARRASQRGNLQRHRDGKGDRTGSFSTTEVPPTFYRKYKLRHFYQENSVFPTQGYVGGFSDNYFRKENSQY